MIRVLLLAVMLAGCSRPVLKVDLSRATLLANGYDTAEIRISGSEGPPKVNLIADSTLSRLTPLRQRDGYWQCEIQANVLPGSLRVRVGSDRRHVDRTLTMTSQITDSASDGTPDFLRLDDDLDRKAFRAGMTYLAEIQYFITPSSRPSEITDCSSLVRYSYREAMRRHDAGWLSDAHLPLVRGISSIRKYSYPHTLLGPNILRTRTGTYSPIDLTNGAFREFADAKTLQQFNMFFVSRNVMQAQPGDVLFYRRQTTMGVAYHSMVFLGTSQVKPDNQIYVVYHTGPDGTNDGEIRRITLTQLLHFPNPQWQSIAANPLFLGVYRWNILKALS